MSKRFAATSGLILLAVLLYLLPGWLVPASPRASSETPVVYHSTSGIPTYNNNMTEAGDAPVENFQFARTHTVDQLSDSAILGYDLESQIDQPPELVQFSAIDDVGISREALEMQQEIEALQQLLQIPTTP